MRRRQSKKGMTLIELLIAVTLFGAISASMGIVLNIAFTSMNKIDSKVDFNRRILASQRMIDQILQGIIPLNVPCAGQPVGLVASSTFVKFLSSYSVSEGSRGRPRIVELFGAPSPNGGMRLLVNEWPYLGRQSLMSACMAPVQVLPSSFILADRLSQVQFLYRRREIGQPSEVWVSGWAFPEWPSGIRLNLAPIRPIPNQIQPTTIYAPLLIMNYNIDEPTQY